MTTSEQPVELTVVETASAEWQIFPVEEINAEIPMIPLLDDPDTGMQIFKMTYVAGFTNPWHTHPCAHGIYVLEGTLRTHQGDHPTGSFVWFPEGGTMHHRATPEADCVFLFITNKPFDIFYGGHSHQA